MTTTRSLCRLLSRHLGMDVTPHAARLVRDGLLAEQNRVARDVMKDIEKFQPRPAKRKAKQR